MLPLTLRPIGLRNSAAFAHLADWSVIEDGEVIGRIYEVHAARSPEMAWFWSLYLDEEARNHVPASGHAATLEGAKAQCRTSLERFKAWPQR
jgi:hypothetical protein